MPGIAPRYKLHVLTVDILYYTALWRKSCNRNVKSACSLCEGTHSRNLQSDYRKSIVQGVGDRRIILLFKFFQVGDRQVTMLIQILDMGAGFFDRQQYMVPLDLRVHRS